MPNKQLKNIYTEDVIQSLVLTIHNAFEKSVFNRFQSILVEGVEYLLAANELRKVAGKAMEIACDKLKRDLATQRIHGLLLLNNKLLSLRSRYVEIANICHGSIPNT